jgi:hypothetical protein
MRLQLLNFEAGATGSLRHDAQWSRVRRIGSVFLVASGLGILAMVVLRADVLPSHWSETPRSLSSPLRRALCTVVLIAGLLATGLREPLNGERDRFARGHPATPHDDFILPTAMF